MEFLPSPLFVLETKISSTFTGSIQLIAICGQLLSHQQQGIAEHAHGLISLDLWDKQKHLHAGLEQAFEGMSSHDPYALILQDSMSCFTELAAKALDLMLFKSSRKAPWGTNNGSEMLVECEKRAIAAAQQMIVISKALIELSYFKVHFYSVFWSNS
jgi:hypothetical protein